MRTPVIRGDNDRAGTERLRSSLAMRSAGNQGAGRQRLGRRMTARAVIRGGPGKDKGQNPAESSRLG